ncbi:hypothetical protein DL95DRAFT_466003 [Leptodontidium sp. 2 PMI_412]|nr:hypothetical protein DL95DRAFT_466003 [Leptodontidium sp. 2 PMI_412]
MASHTCSTSRCQNLKTSENERVKAEQMAASSSQKYDYLKDDDRDNVSTGPAISFPPSVPRWKPTFPAGLSPKGISEIALNTTSTATDGLSWAQLACLKSLDGESETDGTASDTVNLNVGNKAILLSGSRHGRSEIGLEFGLTSQQQSPVALYGGWTPIPKFLNPGPIRDDLSEAGDVDLSLFFSKSESESQTLAALGPSTSQKILSWADDVSDASERNTLNHDYVVMPKSEYAGPNDELLNRAIDLVICGFASGGFESDDDELLNEQATAPIFETGHELGDEGPTGYLRDMIIDIPPFVLESESESETEILNSQPEPLRNSGTEAAGDMGSQQGWTVVGKKGKRGKGRRGNGEGT